MQCNGENISVASSLKESSSVFYYLARAMSPSPDPVEAIVGSWDLGSGTWDLGLSGLVWRI